MTLILIIILAIIIYILIKYLEYIKDYFRNRKYCFKFPIPAGRNFLFGHVKLLLKSPEEAFAILSEIAEDEKYQPIFLIQFGPMSVLHVATPEVAAIIMSSRKHIEKSRLYTLMESWLGKGLLTSAGQLWHKRRRLLNAAFHFSILSDYIGIFHRESKLMVEKIQKQIGEDRVKVNNVTTFIDEMTLRTISETSMGIKLDSNNEEAMQYKKNIFEECLFLHNRFDRPWLHIDWIYFNLTSKGRREKQVIKSIHEFTENVIQKRLENFQVFDSPTDAENEQLEIKNKKPAMLDLLLNEKIKKASIDSKDIRDEVNTFLFAGHDTTGLSIGYTLMLLACHKEIQEELYAEILEVLGPTKEPSHQDFQDMNLLDRCIKESLRLYPAAPVIGRKANEDIITEAGLIPKGTTVNIRIYDIHRNPKHWPNPEKFDPSRFLPENSTNRHPFAYVPFSAGPRNCIGKRFALLQLKSVVCNVLRNFVLEPVDTPQTITLVLDIVLRTKNGIQIKFILRD